VLAHPLEGLLQDAAACSRLTSLHFFLAAAPGQRQHACARLQLLWVRLLRPTAFSGSIRSLSLQAGGLPCMVKPWMVARLLAQLMPQLERLEVGGGGAGQGGGGG
jgi:hypothetical protein